MSISWERFSDNKSVRERLSEIISNIWESLPAAMSNMADIMDRMVDSVINFSSTNCFGYVQDPEANYIEGKYEFRFFIGEGQTASVYKCICKNTREEVACKITPDTKNAHTEIYILHCLNFDGDSPGILKFRDCAWPEQRHPHKSKYHVYLVTELCNGRDLRRIVQTQRRRLPHERETAKIIKSLVESLRFCHEKRVIHRDVKLSSILLSYDAKYITSWTTKLGNFDRAIRVKPGQHFVYDNVGTVGYSAPEMRSGRGYLYEVDIWSAGVVLYLLLCGRMPFDQAENEANGATTYDQILGQNTKPDVSRGRWRSVSDSAKDLVLGMLQKRIWNRLSCDQILSTSHDLVNLLHLPSYYNVIVENMYNYMTYGQENLDAGHPWILGNTGDVSTSRVATSGNKEKTYSSKIDTTAASCSESNKEVLDCSCTTVREADTAPEIVTDTEAASEILISNSRVNTVVDSNTQPPGNGYSGSTLMKPLLSREMKGKSKEDIENCNKGYKDSI